MSAPDHPADPTAAAGRPARRRWPGRAARWALLPTIGVLLAGCASGPAPVLPSAATTGSPSLSTTTTAPTGPDVPSTRSIVASTDIRTVQRGLRDPEVGYEILVTKVARRLSWPVGYEGQELAFELVGLEMRWTTGTTYTAPLRALDLAIVTTSTYPNRPDRLLDPTLVAAGWTMLPDTLPPGQTATGWLVFKVDPRGAADLRLDFARPAMRVTNASETISRQVFSIDLTGPEAASSVPATSVPGSGPAPASPAGSASGTSGPPRG